MTCIEWSILKSLVTLKTLNVLNILTVLKADRLLLLDPPPLVLIAISTMLKITTDPSR